MKITLSPGECVVATAYAEWFVRMNRQAGRRHNELTERTPEQILSDNIRSAKAEMAVAKALGIYYPFPIDTFHKFADVGDLEVRSTCMPGHGLEIRPTDNHDRRYVLVHVDGHVATLKGWRYGDEVWQHQQYRRYGQKGEWWCCPPYDLRPVNDLKEFGGDL